jgi:hypothetical protein
MRPVTRICIAVVVLALALSVVGCDEESEKDLRTITVQGAGQVSVVPDEARFNVSIVKDTGDPKSALAQASNVSNAVLAVLKKGGLSEKEIRTSTASVVPRTSYSGGMSRTVGYRGQVTIDVKTEKLGEVGTLMAAAVKAGASKVNGPRFSVSLDNKARQDALVEAIKDARNRADAMAAEAGVGLAKMHTIEQEIQSGFAEDQAWGARSVGSPTFSSFPHPDIEPGESDLTARVRVVWELK